MKRVLQHTFLYFWSLQTLADFSCKPPEVESELATATDMLIKTKSAGCDSKNSICSFYGIKITDKMYKLKEAKQPEKQKIFEELKEDLSSYKTLYGIGSMSSSIYCNSSDPDIGPEHCWMALIGEKVDAQTLSGTPNYNEVVPTDKGTLKLNFIGTNQQSISKEIILPLQFTKTTPFNELEDFIALALERCGIVTNHTTGKQYHSGLKCTGGTLNQDHLSLLENLFSETVNNSGTGSLNGRVQSYCGRLNDVKRHDDYRNIHFPFLCGKDQDGPKTPKVDHSRFTGLQKSPKNIDECLRVNCCKGLGLDCLQKKFPKEYKNINPALSDPYASDEERYRAAYLAGNLTLLEYSTLIQEIRVKNLEKEAARKELHRKKVESGVFGILNSGINLATKNYNSVSHITGYADSLTNSFIGSHLWEKQQNYQIEQSNTIYNFPGGEYWNPTGVSTTPWYCPSGPPNC